MIRKNNVTSTLPGVNDQTVKLRTLRPIVLSNMEHVGEFHMLYLRENVMHIVIGKWEVQDLLTSDMFVL